jgi:uncharacterized protein (TIGR02246 family)
MRKLSTVALLALLIGATVGRALAADVTTAELVQAATELGHQYDANYAAKSPAAMAALYASDGVLVTPVGPIVRGKTALVAYYTKRFESGAYGHAIKVIEVHVQGNGGFAIEQFLVTVPRANGEFHQEHGIIVTILERDPDGWHMRLVEPSVTEQPGK